MHETQLLDLPTAVCTFMMDTNEPAVAVSSGTNVFIYKTIRPYFKFTLPLLEVRFHIVHVRLSLHCFCFFFAQVNSKENELWQLVKEVSLVFKSKPVTFSGKASFLVGQT